MDINEVKHEGFHRHPWELSRTKCVIKDIRRFIDIDRSAKYLNVGAGDLFFDRIWIEKNAKKHFVHAVDIGYDLSRFKEWDKGKCKLYTDLSNVEENGFDYILMMDSLEYIEDDVQFINTLSQKLLDNGKMIFTLPAYSKMYSQYDINVGNLRRYSKTEFERLVHQIPGLKIDYAHYFYFSLLCVRVLQRLLNKGFVAHEEVTTNWKYPEKSFVSVFIQAVLNIDYALCKLLRKINFPGLSLLVICSKN